MHVIQNKTRTPSLSTRTMQPTSQVSIFLNLFTYCNISRIKEGSKIKTHNTQHTYIHLIVQRKDGDRELTARAMVIDDGHGRGREETGEVLKEIGESRSTAEARRDAPWLLLQRWTSPRELRPGLWAVAVREQARTAAYLEACCVWELE